MRNLIILSILTLFPAGIAFAQQQTEIPKLDINPDPFILSKKVIDSIYQYTYPAENDSTFLHKWVYNHLKEGDLHEAVMYYWNPSFRAWSTPRGKYVYAFDPEGRLRVQDHYTYMDSHGNWKGCDSDGCGKREWAYDKEGHQILLTQSYWQTYVTDWREFEIRENLFDLSGNMVLESIKYRNKSDPSYWYGSKNEFSYDAFGNQTGQVIYGWTGGDPYDWFPQDKEERYYDKNGNLITYVVYRWAGRWITDSRYGRAYWSKLEFKYDPDGRKKSVLLYNWDSDLNDWILDIEEEDIRNADGQLISEMAIRFSGGGYPSRKEYAYDAAGKRITEITTSWAEWSWTWGVKVKNEYTYDSLGAKVMDIVSNWNTRTESWIKYRKTLYGFDPDGRQVLNIEYYWNPDTGDWTGLDAQGRQEWAFDPSGREISYSTYEWDPEIKDWVGKAKTEHKYDESGKMIHFAGYDWDHKASVWKGDDDIGKKEWGYDPAGRLITEMEFIWNPQDKDWEENIRLTAMYDPDGDPAEYRQSWWNPDSGEWEKVLRYFFHYKSGVTGKPEIIANDIQVYPNPTEGPLTISGLSQPANFMLYSIQGQLLRTYSGIKGGIDISDLPTGAYLLNLILGNNTIVKKTVIKK